MRIFQTMLAPVAVFGLAASLGAQETPRPPSTTRSPASPRSPAPARESCVTVDGRTECERTIRIMRNDSALMKRAALGLQVTATGSVRDSMGVFVTHVSPKGPAENAGIIEGDRIVSINGVDLRLSPADAEDNYTSGLPGHRLTREVAKLTPGSVANVRVYSGGRIRDVRVTAGRATDLNAFMFRNGPGMGNRMMEELRMAPMRTRSFQRIETREGGEELRRLAPLRTQAPRRIRIMDTKGRDLIDDDVVIIERTRELDEAKKITVTRKK